MVKLKEKRLKKETAIGRKTNVMNWIPETKQQKALREFMYQVTKSLKLLGLIDKIPFLKYKNWIKIRIKRDEIKI